MLLVFFDSFPKPSERFLHRDLEGLLERCAGVRLGALRRVYDEPPPFPVNSIYGNEASICDLLAGLFCPVFYACAFSALFRLGPCAFLFLLRRFGALRCIAKETPLPGRVHSMHGGWCGLAAWVLARRMRVPFSFSCHARDVFVQKRLLKFLLRRADHVITCNSKANAVVREAAPGACRSYFIPHPVSEPFRKRSSEGGYLLAAGRPVPKKDYPNLLQAFEMIREQHPSVELRIAGVTAGQLGEVPQGVSPLGFVSPFEMDELYAGARVFIHAGKTAPDGDSDGLPNVLLEALTAGVPVASTDAGAVRDIVEHRLTGLLVPERDPVALASAVTELLENEGLRAKLAANGRDRVLERHDPGKCAKELAEVLCPSDL